MQLNIVASIALAGAAVLAGCKPPNSGRTFEYVGPPGTNPFGPQGDGGSGSDSGDTGPDSGSQSSTGNTSAATSASTSGGPGGTSAGPTTTASGDSSATDDDGSAAPVTGVHYAFQTIPYGGEYDPDHVVAIWIERDGSFVRTLEVHADNRIEHLVRWRLASDENDNDAITGATIEEEGDPISGTWDLVDADGNPAPPDGAYTFLVEFTEDNSDEGEPEGPVLEVPFRLDEGAFNHAPADTAEFSGVGLRGT
jgi:hypothetical protein